MDDDLKKSFEATCNDMGMPMAVAMTIFAKRVVRERKIPFDVSAAVDPFYSEKNMQALKHSAKQLDEGKIVTKSLEELEALENA